MRRTVLTLLVAIAPWLAGCDLLGIEPASQVAARREAEGKAIGGACRHAARSIEACYEQNKRADKAAVFAGWREMNDYMRENKLDPMPAPETTAVAAADAGRAKAGASESSAGADASAEPARKSGAKPARRTEPH